MSFQDYYAAEDMIVDLLRKDFMGPVGPDETLTEAPLDAYSVGILWPQKFGADKTKAYEKEEGAESTKDFLQQLAYADGDVVEDLQDNLDNPHGQINAANVYRPSAMALTMVVKGSEKSLVARFTCATYLHREEEMFYEKKLKDSNGIEYTEKARRIEHIYTRNAIDCGDVVFDLRNREALETNHIPDNIKIDFFVRKIFSDGSRLITVSITNKAIAQNKKIVQNTSALFQCHLSVKSEEGFLPLSEKAHTGSDAEALVLDMLYRDVRNFGSGHGCSVKWNEVNDFVQVIESEFMPATEILQMEPCQFPGFQCFSMGYWTEGVREEGCNELESFVSLYDEWLTGLVERAKELGRYERAASESFQKIRQCSERLKKGIVCLRYNETAWKSFVYMNEAMHMQRINYRKTKKLYTDPDTVTWYPFQLAFVLQIIPDIVDRNSEWRDTVDLLWFPTGGGKTEAYLGLLSFVIFFRKLSMGKHGNGVTVIMRYTLRLLTAQQFERASSLICACEYLRQKNGIPGSEISIGLWVGLDVTPNSLEKANENIQKLHDGEHLHKGNPVQIFHCSFCGSDIRVGNYKIKDTMVIMCPDVDCHFKDGLPIYVVDEDIYNKRPTLLISTIDKFARIVWEERTVALFGSDGLNAPPELIIQDELHLISGPLGSISGLYEAAVDELCTRGESKPKIIVSTATVRNAQRQIKGLYNRTGFQFPPSGIEINHSFFAKRADKTKQPARRYIGICETGGSLLDALIRVYGCMFFAMNYLQALGVSEKVIDQYFTIVGYFNSLKDLGSSATVIMDRVGLYSNSLRLYKFKELAEAVKLDKININSFSELTSRKSSSDIKEVLENLEIKYPDERAYSYVLASNMLSVGIDISRLGVMTVYNQPKTNAEYIQATSRVGRTYPGMVLALYNAMRSRDKSHYEQFGYYHQTFYKHVEPTSVTPFSFRAVEKALHSVYVALIRHKIPEMRANQSVVNYRKNHPAVLEIKDFILRRVKDVDCSGFEYAQDWLKDFEGVWERAAREKHESFLYATIGKQPDNIFTLLIEAEKENYGELPSTLNSLRNVDSSSNIFIVGRHQEEA